MKAAVSGAKRRYDAAHYTQIKVSLHPETAAVFKAKCKTEGISMAGAIERLTGAGPEKKPLFVTDTRQKRRKAIKSLIPFIEAVMDAEQRYIDNIPENLQGSALCDAAGQTVSALEEALDLLREAY